MSAASKKAAAAEATKDRDKLLTQAYTAATTELRQAHQAEFNDLYTKQAAARGVEWKPKPTKAEQAKAKVAELLAEYPGMFNDDPETAARLVASLEAAGPDKSEQESGESEQE